MSTGGVDLVVVGGGPAGMACATEAARRGARVALYEREALGGRVATLTRVRGLAGGDADGPDLVADLVVALLDAEVDVRYDEVTGLAPGRVLSGGEPVDTAAVVLATGARVDLGAVPGAEPARGRGVSLCASCDGPLFTGHDVAVVGTGRDRDVEIDDLRAFARSVVAVDPDDVVEVVGVPVSGLRVRGPGGTDLLPVTGVFFAGPAVPVRELGLAGVTPIGDVRPGATWSVAGALADGREAARRLVGEAQRAGS